MSKTMVFTLGALIFGTLGASVYTIDAREVAVVTSFGAAVRSIDAPGLYFRAPWPIHMVQRFDRRARMLAVEPTELLTRDKKNLVVEPFVIWRVNNPERFLESVVNRDDGGADPIRLAELQLSGMVVSQVGDGLGKRDFAEILSVEAAGQDFLPPSVGQGVRTEASGRLGIEVLQVGLRHVGLPMQNEQSIYERMRAERLRIANAERAEGEEKAAAIRAEADRKATEITANADREAAFIRATAEGTAARLYAESAKQDPEFYKFVRKLEAYESILTEDTTLVVDTESELFRLLQSGPR